MPKGYYIGRVTVKDPDAYKAYAAKATEAIRLHNGTVLARGGVSEPLEGDCRPRNVVVEFDSLEAARRFYFSPEYQAAVAMRQPISEGEFVLVEGYAPG